MRSFCHFLKLVAIVQAALLFMTSAYGVVVESKGDPKLQTARVDRVRIPIRLTPYHKVLVKNKDGQIQERQIAMPSMTHTLRARMERVNHFYVGSWHGESVPLKWESEFRRYQVRLRFFERFGTSQELEEYVGNSEITGTVEKEGDLFAFKGYAASQFKNPMGTNLLDVEIGQSKTPATQPLLSKSIPNNP